MGGKRDEGKKKKNPAMNADKYKEEYAQQAKSLMAVGMPQKDLAAFFEVREETITRWKERHEPFRNAIKKGAIGGRMSVTKALFELAQSGNVAAQIFWLCNRAKDEWQQTQKIEQNVTDRKILEVVIKNPDGTKTLAGRIFPHTK